MAVFVECLLEIKKSLSEKERLATGPYVAFASFGLLEVIYVYFLTSLRKYWAILDLNQIYIIHSEYLRLTSAY